MPIYIPNILNGQESTFYPRQYLGTVVVLCWSSHKMSPDIGGWIQGYNDGKIERIQKILRVFSLWGSDKYNVLGAVMVTKTWNFHLAFLPPVREWSSAKDWLKSMFLTQDLPSNTLSCSSRDRPAKSSGSIMNVSLPSFSADWQLLDSNSSEVSWFSPGPQLQ